jgi:signal transduction histidine kinase
MLAAIGWAYLYMGLAGGAVGLALALGGGPVRSPDITKLEELYQATKQQFALDPEAAMTIAFIAVAALSLVALTLLLGLVYSGRKRRRLEERRLVLERHRELFYMVAHEMKGPMSTVMLYGESVLEEKTAEGKNTYAAKLIRELKRLDRSLKEVLEFSSLEAGQYEIRETRFSLRELAGDVAEEHEPSSAEKRLRVEICERDLEITADRYLLKYAISNLLSNAIKFTPEGGRVRIAWEPKEGGAEISVYNTGPPVPEGAARRIWDPFYKDGEGEAAGAGTGLGLSIVRSVARLHGGGHGVENTEEGVRFWFSVSSKKYLPKFPHSI